MCRSRERPRSYGQKTMAKRQQYTLAKRSSLVLCNPSFRSSKDRVSVLFTTWKLIHMFIHCNNQNLSTFYQLLTVRCTKIKLKLDLKVTSYDSSNYDRYFQNLAKSGWFILIAFPCFNCHCCTLSIFSYLNEALHLPQIYLCLLDKLSFNNCMHTLSV